MSPERGICRLGPRMTEDCFVNKLPLRTMCMCGLRLGEHHPHGYLDLCGEFRIYEFLDLLHELKNEEEES